MYTFLCIPPPPQNCPTAICTHFCTFTFPPLHTHSLAPPTHSHTLPHTPPHTHTLPHTPTPPHTPTHSLTPPHTPSHPLTPPHAPSQLLHSCFSSWYLAVVERRAKLSKAAAVCNWKLLLRAWRAWRVFVGQRRERREREAITREMQREKRWAWQLKA